jgi:DNA-binding NtrC family response regulator
MTARILIVDDVPANLSALSDTLEPEGYQILVARSGEQALETAARARPDLILLDVMMPGLDGYETCRRLKASEATRGVPVIFLTVHDEVEKVVEGFRAGGVDYVGKPFQTEELLSRIQTHLRIHFLSAELERKNQQLQAEINERRRAEEEVRRLAGREAGRWGVGSFIGQSAAIRGVIEAIQKVHQFTSVNVLITGESGTGKELVARAIHFEGPAGRAPFVPVNCSAIPGELAESSFFGHVKGAFTGAVNDRPGYFEQADGGTLFLDEVGDLPLALQGKLLRALEDGLVAPVGSARTTKHVTFRVLSATNVDLQPEIEAGRFRADLYFRLSGFSLPVPALREHKEDLPSLANHFLERLATEMGMRPPRLNAAALAALDDYDYPGNVRELKNLIERALIESGGGEVGPEHLHFLYPHASTAGPTVPRDTGRGESSGTPPDPPGFRAPSDEARILEHVRQHGGINNAVCRDLLGVGIQRACYLLRKLHRAGLLAREHSRRSALYRPHEPDPGRCGGDRPGTASSAPAR